MPIQGWSPTFRYYDTEFYLSMDLARVPTSAFLPVFDTQVIRAVRNNRTLRVEAAASVNPIDRSCHVSYTVEENDNSQRTGCLPVLSCLLPTADSPTTTEHRIALLSQSSDN